MVNLVIENNIWLAAGLLTVQFTSNAVGFRSTGYLPLPGAQVLRLGWYASGRGVGWALRPIMDAGVLLGARGLDASVGVLANWEAASSEPLLLEWPNPLYGVFAPPAIKSLETERDILVLDNEVREHFLGNLMQRFGIFAALSLSGKYIISHTNPFEQGRYYISWQLLMGRDAFLLKHWSVHGLASFSTDLRNRTIATVIAAVEDTELGVTGAIYVKSDTRIRFSELERGEAIHQVVFVVSGSMPADLQGRSRISAAESQSVMQELRRFYQKR
jgi:hypothetical protein